MAENYDELLRQLESLWRCAPTSPSCQAAMYAARAIRALQAEVESGRQLGAKVLELSEWIQESADALDADIPKGQSASPGSLALTAAHVRLAELISGEPDPENPTPAMCLVEAKERTAKLLTKAETLDLLEKWLRADPSRDVELTMDSQSGGRYDKARCAAQDGLRHFAFADDFASAIREALKQAGR